MDVRRGDGGFGGGDRDLVEAQHHIARRIEARHAGFVVVGDDQAAVLAALGAELDGQLDVRVGAQRRIEDVEAARLAFPGQGGDAVVLDVRGAA